MSDKVMFFIIEDVWCWLTFILLMSMLVTAVASFTERTRRWKRAFFVSLAAFVLISSVGWGVYGYNKAVYDRNNRCCKEVHK